MSAGFVFPGQGSQSVGMGRDLHEGFQEVRELYDEASEALGYDVAALSFEGPKDQLDRTEKTQPCVLTASVAAFRALTSRGVSGTVFSGHSVGEYSALVAAGSLAFADSLRLTELRGRLMQEAVPEGSGLMAAVLGLDRAKVDGICASVKSGYVAAANYNCPGQVVVSGEKRAVEEAMALAREAGAKRAIALSVSVPSHCRLMEGASRKLSEVLKDLRMEPPRVPVIGNAEAAPAATVEDIKAALVKQLHAPVRWEDCVLAMVRSGVDTFVEVGPGKVLSGLIKRISPESRVLNVEDRQSLEKTALELGA
ncbi:MAG: ACP S-malonyltransferase [Thermodesulfovibrionales bacterium]